MLKFDFTSLESFLAIAVVFLFIIQLCYWFGIYNRLHKYFVQNRNLALHPENLPPLSVVMVTKDSGKMLEENLPSILEQDYPEFEVIVVNDLSSGEDEDILKLMETRYRNLYHTFIPDTARYISLKKLGITMGIKASKYDWIVVTEPNCRPVSNKWLQNIASQIDSRTDVILGYSNYDTEDNRSLFVRRIVTDTLFQAMRFLGRAIKRKPYMGIGRNMAYRKSVFERHKGFVDQLNLERGEDDLFVNAIATRRNTKVVLSSDSFVRISLPQFQRLWHSEKVNLLVTGEYYKGSARIHNSIDSWTCFLMHCLSLYVIVASLLTQQWILAGIVALVWLIRHVSVIMIMKKAGRDLGEKHLYFLPLYDLLRPLWSFSFKLKYWFRDKYDFVRH